MTTVQNLENQARQSATVQAVLCASHATVAIDANNLPRAAGWYDTAARWAQLAGDAVAAKDYAEKALLCL